MQWLICSDLHLSDRQKDGYRFGIFRWLAKQQKKYSPEATFLLGDLTQDKDNHSSALVNRTIDELTLLQPPVYILRGNHDGVDHNNPFFRFLNCIEGIHFIVEPEEITTWAGGGLTRRDPKRVAMIPHCRTQEQFNAACKAMLQRPHALMLHQTIAGAIAETGRPLNGFSASPVGLIRPLRCYSGDVHRPQTCGLITYVGAPYRITFGDRFTPRIILVKNDKDVDLHFPTISKHTITLERPEDLHQSGVKKGDQVKLRIEVGREDAVNWNKIKAKILLECKNLGLEVFGTEILTKQNPRNVQQTDPHNIIRPKDIFNSFCKREKVTKQIVEAGALLLDAD